MQTTQPTDITHLFFFRCKWCKDVVASPDDLTPTTGRTEHNLITLALKGFENKVLTHECRDIEGLGRKGVLELIGFRKIAEDEKSKYEMGKEYIV